MPTFRSRKPIMSRSSLMKRASPSTPTTASNPLKIQAQSDPRMYAFYKKMMFIWDQKVGGLMNLYGLNEPFWGLLPTLPTQEAPSGMQS